MNKKNLLFSVTKKDLVVTHFSGKGAGGQHRNKHQNCVRIKHPASGALVTGQSHKERKSNIKEALQNLVSSPKYRVWANRIVYEVMSGQTIEEKVNKMIKIENLKIEYKDAKNKWSQDEKMS